MKKIKPNWYESPVSFTEIEKIENNIGYYFPEEYKKIVSQYDQLTPVENIFDFNNTYDEDDERDINFLSFDENETSNIIQQQYISDPEYAGIPHLVAFGFCANGDHVCFDYRDNRQGNNPKVVLLYHDDHVENEDGSLSMVVNFVANSFEEFIDILYDYDEVYDENGCPKPTGIFYDDKEIFRDKGLVAIKTIENFEQNVGYNLPNKYKDLISRHNSVEFISSLLTFKDYYGNIKRVNCRFYGFDCSGKRVDTMKNQSIQNITLYGADNLIAFAQNDNSDVFCFDYRQNTQEPKVVFVYTDVFEKDSLGVSQMVINFVADNFEDFMDMLHE